ncbi:MAG: histidine phosphatase family protein [Clostridium sp.]|nr:histidine phosphatase family protein [Clostridium sp.]
MIKIILIRHSKTQGNIEGRYIGITDEHLCKDGIELLKSKDYPKVEAVYCSPLLRCTETAEIIYKNLKPKIYDGLRECSFGDFENKNYEELKNDEYYQKWIDSNGTLPFPNGEKTKIFKNRCISAFDDIVNDITENKVDTSALIVHGGTIMSILDKYSYPHKEFYNWQAKNGEGYLIEIDEELWKLNTKYIKNIKLI